MALIYGIDSSLLLFELDRATTFNLILDSSLTPTLDSATTPPARFLQAKWSPRGMLFYERCLLATLTNLGAVSVEYSFNRSWVILADISAYWISYCHHLWKPYKTSRNVKPEDQALKLRERAYLLKTTCLAWSKLYGDPNDSYCYLATAQKDGTIVIWRFISTMGRMCPTTPPYLFFIWNSNMENIQSMRWIATGDQRAWLVVGGASGLVEMWHLDVGIGTLLNNEQPVGLWFEKDLMRVVSIYECTPPEPVTDNEFLIVFSKANFVIGVLVDVTNIDKVTVAIHSQRFAEGEVRGMQPMTGASLAVATEKADVSVLFFHRPKPKKINCTLQPIHAHINAANMACHGLASSKNNVLWAMQLCVNKMYDHLILRHPTLTTFFMFSPNEGLRLLVENPTGSFDKYQDCLESIRLNHLTGELLPPTDVEEGELEQLSDYQLRLTLWLATISELRLTDDGDFQRSSQSVSPTRIQMLIFARHAFARMQRILTKAVSGGDLAQLDLMSIHLLRAWVLELRQICKTDSIAATANAIVWPAVALAADKILAGSNGLENLIRETCSVCGEEIECNKDKGAEMDIWRFAMCRRGHRTSRCSASLVQLTIPYYICSICGAVVHSHFVSTAKPHCIYCDGVLRADERVE